MTAFIAYDGRHPVNLSLVRYIEAGEDMCGEYGITFQFGDDSWARWGFDSVEERDYVFAHLPVAEVAPLYPPITPKETA